MVIGVWDLVILLYRPDLLTHKDEIADSEAEKGDGHNGDEMGDDDQNTLQQWKGTLETGKGEPLQRSHEDQTLGRLSHGIENGCGGLTVKGHWRKEGSHMLNFLMLDQYRRINACSTLTDRSDRIGQKSRPQPHEEGKEDPYRQGGESRGGRAPEDHREEDGYPQPEGDIEQADNDIDDEAPDLFHSGHHTDQPDSQAGDDEDNGHQYDADDGHPGEEFSVNDRITIDGLGDQFGQGPRNPFPVDGIKAQKDPDEGAEEPDELDKREEFSGRGEEEQKDEGGFGQPLEFLPDRHPHHGGDDHPDHHNKC